MKFNLQQDIYVDEHGHPISAKTVQVITSYKHICDGFYTWNCGSCGKEHSSRSCGWPIAGQVLKCNNCSLMNLLVKTNIKDIDDALFNKMQYEESNKEAQRLGTIELEFKRFRSEIAHRIATGDFINEIQSALERITKQVAENLKQ